MRAALIVLLLWNLLALNTGGGIDLPTHGTPDEAAGGIIPGELVVGMNIGTKASTLTMPAGASLARTSPELSSLRIAILSVPAGQERAYAQKLQNTTGVQFAEPNYVVTPQAVTPNDSFWSQQYGPAHIHAPEAWSTTTGSDSVILAIIDSGIDRSHPEFTHRLLPGYDFVEDDSNPQDECGHGTHVAGIAAATGNNHIGIAGIAWGVKIMPIRVLNNICTGTTADVAEALVWAVERGARVINLSLGTTSPSTLLENGTYYAYIHGAAIFAAAGNYGSSPVLYPAAYPWVMAVGSTDQSDLRILSSNTGAALDLMAPGKDIYSTTPLGDFFYHTVLDTPKMYGPLSGTSMAAAHASGAAALLASLPQFDTPDKIYQALTSTAADLDVPGRDDNTGYGLIQIDKALAFTPTVVPTPTPLPPTVSYAILNSHSCDNLAQFNWLDATTGTWLPVFGNDGYTTVALPFAFQFGGKMYATTTVSANGYITFDGNGSIKDNFIIPSIAQPNNFLAPFWDDLNPSAGGLLYQQTFGTAPNRQYVIEWEKVPITGNLSADSALTFESVLAEGSNQILFQYKTLLGADADGASATIGVEYADGSAGQQYSYNQAGAVAEGQALLFMPYTTGETPPSNSCSTFTRLVDSSGGFFDPRPFCVEIPAGAVQEPATLQIQNLSHAASPPTGYISLGHFADIRLSYSPQPPLSPLPEVYVCYHYTASDVLNAGGHAENLFLAAYDSLAKKWDVLPTAADTSQGLLTVRAPHLSIYSVVTVQPPATLPVTGARFAFGSKVYLLILVPLCGLIGFIAWRRRRTTPRTP